MRSIPTIWLLAAATGAVSAWAATGCSPGHVSNVFDSGSGAPSDQHDADCMATGSCLSGTEAGDAPGCQGLACQVENCGTTISGYVYDPMGRTPLYNAYVYVPNSPLLDIPTGSTCTACQAPASGSPLPGAVQTDPTGHFSVTQAPTGSNIPLVIQLGKFRREITIPVVNRCVDNHVGRKDSKGLEMATRLPRKQHEGGPNDNIPLIAMATGACDALECLMRRIGIDDSEFGPKGRVNLYQGSGGASGPGSSDAYAFWANKNKLLAYDVVLNSCECGPIARDSVGPAYKAMHDYLSGGGRLFGTHFHYNWFDSMGGQADFQKTAAWHSPSGGSPPPFYINTTFPKGVAFDEWVQNVYKGNRPPPKGQIGVSYSNNDVGAPKGKTTSWIYFGNTDYRSATTAYLSFNTPVDATVDNQCGRAVFSDLHVASGGGGGSFPTECGSATDALTQQETALEFLFFDLSSCVGDDTKPPPPPPPQ